MPSNILLKYSAYNLPMEVVGTTTKLIAPRSHMISCYKKCYIHTLLVYSCPLQELISGHYQICANDINPLSLIGCICGTVIQNLYPLIGTSKKKKPNCSKSRKQLVPSSSCHLLLPLSKYPLVHTHLHVYNSIFSPN